MPYIVTIGENLPLTRHAPAKSRRLHSSNIRNVGAGFQPARPTTVGFYESFIYLTF
jgi:hypothetical protein